MSGRAEDLDWVSAPKVELGNLAGIESPNSSGNYLGFLLLLDANLESVERAYFLPKGTAENLWRIRTTEVPGSATGEVYVSGNVHKTYKGDDEASLFVGKLDGNFVTSEVSGFAWAKTFGLGGSLKTDHAWDVGPDLLAVTVGEPHGWDWLSVNFYDGDGNDKSLPNLRVAASNKDQIILKRVGRGDLRSWTQADYEAVEADGNGRLRRGKWPMDVLFDGPYDQPGNGSGRGYTGYKVSGGGAVGDCHALVVDRRDGSFYLGCNWKSVLPSGLPDFEPWVIKYEADGAMAWWSRLYHEWEDDNGNGVIDMDVDSNSDGTMDRTSEGLTSTPDQYVDALAIDYVRDELVVLARCHGNNVENFWEGVGDEIARRSSGYTSFQKRFTGTQGNIHISWLGRLALPDGGLEYATYVAGYQRGPQSHAPYPGVRYDSWPSHNSGWPDLNTTRVRRGELEVDAQGRAYLILATSPKMVTTQNAYQKLDNSSMDPWNQCVRIYNRELTDLMYSSALTGAWTHDASGNPICADNTQIHGIFPASGGLIAVGYHEAVSSNVAEGNAVPVQQVPAWGETAPTGESALVARLFEGTWELYQEETGAAGKWDDDNGDGRPNFWDYATGGALPVWDQESGEVTFSVNPNAQDVEWSFEESSDLETWSSTVMRGSTWQMTFDQAQQNRFFRWKLDDARE